MKKFLSLLIVSILALAGCGSSSSGGGDDVVQAKTLDEAIANLDGKTITIATSSMGADNPNSQKAKDNHAEGQDSELKKQYFADFEEKTGAKIEFVDLDPAAQVEEVTESVIAGDPIGDVVRVNAGNYETLVSTGMLSDISNVSNLAEDSGKVDTTWQFEIGNILDGKYAIGRDMDARPEMLAFDTDLLTKAGMDKTPFDLWKEGNWTWENAKTYFNDVQKGLGADYQVWGDYPSYITKYGIASGGVIPVEQDGTINYTDDGVYEAMDYYKSLYDDGILTFYFDENGDRDYAQAEEAWLQGNTVFFSLQRWKTGGIASDGKNFGMVPYPIKDGLDPKDVHWPAPAGDVYVVPKGVSDVDSAALVALFEFMYCQNTGGEEPMTIEESLEQIATRDLAVPGNEEALMYMYEQSMYDPSTAFLTQSEDGFSPTTAVQEYLVNGTSLTSAMENGQKELEANVKAVKDAQKENADALAAEESEE